MIVLIPAKGQSTRIPRKNMQSLTDTDTLLTWCIRNWRNICPDARIVVATDFVEVAEVAVGMRCDVYFEPRERMTADRTATELLIEFAEQTADRPIVLSQCTSPFTFRADVLRALARDERTIRSGYMSVVHRSDNQTRLSQHIEPEAAGTGNFIVLNGDADKVEDWINPSVIEPVNQVSAIDINTPADLELARWLAQRITLSDL